MTTVPGGRVPPRSAWCRRRGQHPVQQRDRREVWRGRDRSEIRINVGQVLIRQNLLRIRWHVPPCRAYEVRERRPLHRNRRRDSSSRIPALSLSSVALVTPSPFERDLPLGGVACRRRRLCAKRRRRRDAGRQQRRGRTHHQSVAHVSPLTLYRGCVTTSMSTGSPRLTASTPRLMAAARSFGSVIGPMPTWPNASASFA
jgi:hypothetical protein